MATSSSAAGMAASDQNFDESGKDKEAKGYTVVKAEPVEQLVSRNDAAELVKSDLGALSRLLRAEQIDAGARMSNQAVSNPQYRQALQEELDKARSEVFVSRDEMNRRGEARSQGLDMPQEHAYAGGFTTADMALNRANDTV